MEAVKNLEWKSSPGWPYMKEAPTIGDWLDFNGVHCDELKLQRLWYDVGKVLEDSFETVLRAFIKQEPHKVTKLVEGRERLIMSTPLPVQVVWVMMFSSLNNLESDKVWQIPGKQGMTLYGGAWKLYHRNWVRRGLTYGLDKSGWDWTAPHWSLKLDLELRRRLGRGSRISEWYEIASRLYRNVFENPLIVFSNGLVLRQVVPGIMKSGLYNTISTNGHCQLFVHIAVCLRAGISIYPLPDTLGDDTLQHERHTHDLDLYRDFGVQIKAVSETIEFAGHNFTEFGPIPNYFMKHLVKARTVPDDGLVEYLDSMARMYVHEREIFDFWDQLAHRLGHSLPLSYESYKHWYDISE